MLDQVVEKLRQAEGPVTLTADEARFLQLHLRVRRLNPLEREVLRLRVAERREERRQGWRRHERVEDTVAADEAA